MAPKCDQKKKKYLKDRSIDRSWKMALRHIFPPLDKCAPKIMPIDLITCTSKMIVCCSLIDQGGCWRRAAVLQNMKVD